MDVTEYRSPVKQLLTYGPPRFSEDWPDYTQLGIGPEHVDELISMASDVTLRRGDSGASETWGALHAWRTLGQLRAKAAAQPLLDVVRDLVPGIADEHAANELPRVFAMIGPAAILPLSTFLADETNSTYARMTAADALLEIGQQTPDVSGDCARALSKELRKHVENDPRLNGFLISHLCDLKSRRYLPLIEEAFSADHVDKTVISQRSVELTFGMRKADLSEHVVVFIDFIPADPNTYDARDDRRRREKRQRKSAARLRKLFRRWK